MVFAAAAAGGTVAAATATACGCVPQTVPQLAATEAKLVVMAVLLPATTAATCVLTELTCDAGADGGRTTTRAMIVPLVAVVVAVSARRSSRSMPSSSPSSSRRRVAVFTASATPGVYTSPVGSYVMLLTMTLDTLTPAAAASADRSDRVTPEANTTAAGCAGDSVSATAATATRWVDGDAEGVRLAVVVAVALRLGVPDGVREGEVPLVAV